MTSVYLPRPYEDEPLYGIVARYVAQTGAPSPMALTMSLFGTSQVPSIDLPCNLDRFAESTFGALGLDGEACARRLTLEPYYARYFDPHRRRLCLEALRGRPRGAAHNLFGVASSRVAGLTALRRCPACLDEDLREHGESHWRRIHQIAGVFVCVRHGCRLRVTDVPYQSRGRRDFVDAGAAQDEGELATEAAVSVLVSLAVRCATILASGQIGAVPSFVVARRLGDGLRPVGAGAAMSAAFVAEVGEGLLRSLGCGLDVDSPQNWLLCLLRRPEVGFHPLQHALVDVFAERVGHDLRLGDVIAGAGGEMRAASSHRELAALKARWWKLLKTVPGRDREAASCADPALRTALDRALPGWASGTRPRGDPSPRNHKSFDPNERDGEWSERIRDACHCISSRCPPQRVTRDALERVANLPKGALSRLVDLRETEAVVTQVVETTEAFHLRKVAHAIVTLRGADMPVTLASVRRQTKLTGPISEGIRSVIRAGCDRLLGAEA